VEKKQRFGKIEKKIIEILKNNTEQYSYVECSLRFIAQEINKYNRTNNSKYNSVRNAVDRLEKHKIIQTKIVPVINGWNIDGSERALTKVRMIRLYDPDKTWQCENGIIFTFEGKLEPNQSNCKV